jgi:hypothetical protein
MGRRVLLPALFVIAVLTAALVAGSAAVVSDASYTTSSGSAVTASVETAAAWLRVYSESTDPQDQTGYARRRGLNGVPGPPAATGEDDGLAVDLGDFPDKNVTFAFTRVFSIMTPDEFPDPAITQVSVTVTTLPDPDTDDNILRTPILRQFGATNGGGQTVTLGPGDKYQFNVSVRSRKKFDLGHVYYPRVRLSLTVGGLAGYYSYEFPLQVRDAGGS